MFSMSDSSEGKDISLLEVLRYNPFLNSAYQSTSTWSHYHIHKLFQRLPAASCFSEAGHQAFALSKAVPPKTVMCDCSPLFPPGPVCLVERLFLRQMLSQNFCWDIDLLGTPLRQLIILDVHIYLKEKVWTQSPVKQKLGLGGGSAGGKGY